LREKTNFEGSINNGMGVLKAGIQEKLLKHPTLIEQFEKDKEKTNAHIKAIERAAEVIPKLALYDDLFSGKEMMLLRKEKPKEESKEEWKEEGKDRKK
jgi:hypothetical protein